MNAVYRAGIITATVAAVQAEGVRRAMTPVLVKSGIRI